MKLLRANLMNAQLCQIKSYKIKNNRIRKFKNKMKTKVKIIKFIQKK